MFRIINQILDEKRNLRISILQFKKLLICLALIAQFSFLVYLFFPFPENFLISKSSLEVYSEEKILLKSFESQNGGYNEWLKIEQFPADLLEIIIQSEDKRFRYHFGFDLFAVSRAFFQNIKNLKITSGASTITQQLARILYSKELPKNKFLKKIFEIIISIKLEIHFSKKEILEAYSNLIPMPYEMNGLGNSSKVLFGKNLAMLTDAEKIQLVVLMRGSSTKREIIVKRFMNLWGRVFPNQTIPSNNLNFSFNPIIKNPKDSSHHFLDWLKKENLGINGKFNSSISINLNRDIENIINQELRYIEKFKGTNASVIVLKLLNKDNKLELKAMVGSKNYFDSVSGQVNGSTSNRGAGSTLKPFLYALGFEERIISPNTIIEDSEFTNLGTEYGETYIPRNNDFSFWGKMTAREALVNSRNIPAFKLIDKIGVLNFQEFLIKSNIMTKFDPSGYGSGLALGVGGTNLLNLTHAYSAFATKGKLHPIILGNDSSMKQYYFGKEVTLFSEETAYKMTNILSEREMRRRAFGKKNFLDFPFDVASKTGTSKDSRDAWTIGFSKNFVVGVWVGNLDGSKMEEVSGGWGAGRIFHEVMRLVTGRDKPKFEIPNGVEFLPICRISGKRANENCPKYQEIFFKKDLIPKTCANSHNINEFKGISSEKAEIISPVSGEVFILNPTLPLYDQRIPIQINLNTNESRMYQYKITGMNSIRFSKNITDFIKLNAGKYDLKLYEGKVLLKEIEFFVK
ncbi:MAG: transglycosylase domain-containing protein [Leptospiraceae bacterium]|nr:transglycosylase domain-containing protein [Leptospiraceae bacterium]